MRPALTPATLRLALRLGSSINDAIVPGKQGDALTDVARELNFQSSQYAELYDGVHRREMGCDARLAATLHLYERLINDPEPGTYHVLVQGGAAFADVSLQGTVTEEVGPQGTFNIELVFLSGATDGQRAVFESARDRWEAAITADLSNTDFGSQPFPANACTGGQREVVDVLDDLRIYVNLVPIDGPSGTLGSAGPCALRDPEPRPGYGTG